MTAVGVVMPGVVGAGVEVLGVMVPGVPGVAVVVDVTGLACGFVGVLVGEPVGVIKSLRTTVVGVGVPTGWLPKGTDVPAGAAVVVVPGVVGAGVTTGAVLPELLASSVVLAGVVGFCCLARLLSA